MQETGMNRRFTRLFVFANTVTCAAQEVLGQNAVPLPEQNVRLEQNASGH
jgi:hypothetical protein